MAVITVDEDIEDDEHSVNAALSVISVKNVFITGGGRFYHKRKIWLVDCYLLDVRYNKNATTN